MRIAKTSEFNENRNTIHINQKSQEKDAAIVSGGKLTEEKEEVGKATEDKKGVTVEISEKLKEMYEKQAESAKKAAEGMEDLAKLMEIARRISKGDHVPPNDEKKLAEYDSDLYQMAKAAAALHAKEKHKKHASLFEEEEDGTTEERVRDVRREAASNEASSAAEAASSPAESDNVVENEV